MKEKLSNRRILQIVSASVVCGLFVIGAILGVVLGICLSPNGDDILPEQKDNPFIFDVAEENCVQLSSTASTVADDGTVSQTLTASITPSSAPQYFVWSISFANPNSAWANGKTVTDYVTLSNVDNSGTATVTCLQGFSEQIIVKVMAVADNACSASATIDYANRIKSFDIKIFKDGVENETIDFDDEGHTYTFEGSLVYDELGTKKVGTPTITYAHLPQVVNAVCYSISGAGTIKTTDKIFDISEPYVNKFPDSFEGHGIDAGWITISMNRINLYPQFLLEFKKKLNSKGRVFPFMGFRCVVETDYFSFREDKSISMTASFSSLNVSNVTIDNSNITF